MTPLIWTYVQSWTFAYIQLLNKPHVNRVTLREQNPSFKCYKPLELVIFFFFFFWGGGGGEWVVTRLTSYYLSKLMVTPKSQREVCASAFDPGLTLPWVE